MREWAVGETRICHIHEQLLCRGCGHLSSCVIIDNGGVHLQGRCERCKRYLKNVGKENFPGLRIATGEAPQTQESLF